MIPPQNEPERRARRRRRAALPGWLLGGLLGAAVLATVFSCYLILGAARAWWPGGGVSGGSAATQAASGGGPAPATSLPAWSGTRRVTILLMGMDRDSGDSTTPNHTDSMMLVSVDPVSRTVVLLSIPRDLWVEIPGYGSAKITQANFDGDAYGYPGGGPALAVKTVEQNLGINVDHYVRVDFNAFETFVDAIGGIDVNVPETIDDPTYPDSNFGYEPFYLAAGPQHLNGRDALRYARTRHSGQGDLDRARRQQQVILAVRDRVLNLNLLPALMVKAPLLYQSLVDDIKMDMTLNEVLSLALLGQKIPKEHITSVVIDYNYVTDATTPDGQQVLMPIGEKLRALRDSLFTGPGVNELALVTAEGASVEVLNGAGVAGLAQATADWLRAQGIHVATVDTADRSDYTQTQIVDYTGKPRTTAWLARALHVANPTTGSAANGPADITIILGADWSVPVSGSSTP